MVTLALPFQYNTDKHGLASSWAELVDVIIVPLVQSQPTLGTSVFVPFLMTTFEISRFLI